MLIEIKVAQVNGVVHFLPAGDLAHALARLCDVDKLVPSVLSRAAEWLDAEVVIVEGNCDAAARALATFMEPVAIH